MTDLERWLVAGTVGRPHGLDGSFYVSQGVPSLLVARERAPELDEDEWWAHDLEGCSVHDGALEVGLVTRLLALPSCDVLEVQRTSEGAPLLVPLITDAVREVDIDGQAIDVDLRFLGEA